MEGAYLPHLTDTRYHLGSQWPTQGGLAAFASCTIVLGLLVKFHQLLVLGDTFVPERPAMNQRFAVPRCWEERVFELPVPFALLDAGKLASNLFHCDEKLDF